MTNRYIVLFSIALHFYSIQFLEVNKAFQNIFQEEGILEETKKEHQNYLAKITKLQKQLEAARKKGDQAKVHSLENETSAVSPSV